MGKTEIVQLFSKIILQNEELKELMEKSLEGQRIIQEKQQTLREGQSKLLGNQKIIWEKLKP